MSKFWNWVKNELYINGTIAENSWFDDDITPEVFKADLKKQKRDIVVWINSPGGDCIAASRIYTMLLEHPGNVVVKIDGIAASAASVIAMAGTEVLMAPTALMMIHNPLTVAIGDEKEMAKAIETLGEFKESIINAYELKTGLSREYISNLMDGETWMNATKAIELGFCDGILKRDNESDINYIQDKMIYSRRAVSNSLVEKIKQHQNKVTSNRKHQVNPRHQVADVMKRLDLLKL